MKRINWQNYEWITQERWGNHHPGGSNVWYDSSQVKIEDNILHLGVSYNPLKVESGEIPFGVGLVSCVEQFGYGTFELEAKLPCGQPYAWPAFWMWSWESWPPEIDIIEAYSNSRGSYFNWTGEILLGKIWRCETNIHLGQQPKNYSLGAKKHRFTIKDPSKNWIKYKLVWTKDYLEFYYDDKLVRVVDDEKSISQLRGKKMNVIINNSLQKPYLDKTKTYQFMVKNFKYLSL
jgi:hypothetical protein